MQSSGLWFKQKSSTPYWNQNDILFLGTMLTVWCLPDDHRRRGRISLRYPSGAEEEEGVKNTVYTQHPRVGREWEDIRDRETPTLGHLR